MTVLHTTPINGATRLAGIVGWPVAHTLSPALHNAAFRFHRINAVYVPLGVPREGLRPLLRSLQTVGALGVNVTVPYKEAVIPLLDRCAPSAAVIGAVNTVVFEKNRLVGHNTDGLGFMASLGEVLAPRGQHAVLLGAGGAGRAVAISLALAGVKRICLAEPDARRRQRLVRDVKKAGLVSVAGVAPNSPALRRELAECRLLVQASPLGLRERDPLPLPAAWMPAGICVMDLVYGKKLTPFLTLARGRGNRIIPGWKMLLHQGAESFRLWTKKKPPLDVMRQALLTAGGSEL